MHNNIIDVRSLRWTPWILYIKKVTQTAQQLKILRLGGPSLIGIERHWLPLRVASLVIDNLAVGIPTTNGQPTIGYAISPLPTVNHKEHVGLMGNCQYHLLLHSGQCA